MKVSEAAQAAARLAVVTEKSETALADLLRKWYAAQFIKGIKLPLLRSIHQAGAYPAFAQFLAEATDADRSTILNKLDKYYPDIQMRPKSEIMRHIEDLAAGRAAPAGKPKAAPKPKKPKVSASKRQVGIISSSKY